LYLKGNPSTASPDALATLPASKCKPIEYPPFEPPLSTDLMSSVALTGTNHGEGEAVHFRVMRGVGSWWLFISTSLHASLSPSRNLKMLILLVAADADVEKSDVDVDAQETPVRTYTRTWGDVCGLAAARMSGGGV
jgi:hypothetical protein